MASGREDGHGDHGERGAAAGSFIAVFHDGRRFRAREARLQAALRIHPVQRENPATTQR